MVNRITTGDIIQQTRIASSSGYRNPPTGTSVEILALPVTVQKRLAKSQIDEEEYLKMLHFAQQLPRGHRKLNDEDLTKLVIGMDEAPGTNTQGLRKGGQVSETILDDSRKPLKTKALQLNIKNKNRLATNPNFASFKNRFKLGSN
tara:strand:- start:728 stop:1165 length:438 start_codon:yes stop_codon:yes gene_type:complete